MSDVVIVTLAEFYQEYPEFNTEEYSTICPICFRRAKGRIKIRNCGRLRDNDRKDAIYLFTAHLSLLTYKNRTGQGNSGGAGQVASASVGEVSVSYVPIPNEDAWSYWLTLSPYGLELLALLEGLTAVPMYGGGSMERVL